jgi:hypothetical protein
MVTPVYKNAGDVTNESALVFQEPHLSADGQSLETWSTASFAGTAGNTSAVGSPYLSRRTASGWVTTSKELPESQFLVPELPNETTGLLGGSLDGLNEALLAQGVSQPSNRIDIYRVGADGSVLDVGPTLPPTAPSAPNPKELAKIGSLVMDVGETRVGV